VALSLMKTSTPVSLLPRSSVFICLRCCVLRNFVFYLARKGWGLVICHGPDNAAYVRRVVRGRA
jgi:hypothetical protein